MNLYQCFLIKNACYKNNVRRNPKGIVVHSTGANNPNLQRYVQPIDGQTEGVNPSAVELKNIIGVNRYGNHWNQYYADGTQGRFACVNAFIGKLANGSVATVQTLPWDMLPWGCGAGSIGSYNNTHVQFEICEDDLTDRSYFDQVMDEAAELCAYLCKLYGIPTSKVVSHHESYIQGMGSNHSDIDHWLKKFGENMDDFRARVEQKRKESQEDEPMTAEEKQAFKTLQSQVQALSKENIELKNKYNELFEQVGVKWAYIDKNLPEWAAPTIDKLYNNEILQGNDQGSLELSYQFLRTLVILDRAGCFGNTWDVSETAAESMKKANEYGIMDNEEPQRVVSRAQMASVATRIIEKLQKEG